MTNKKRRSSHDLTKELIIEKARGLFIEKGFRDVSMRSIAKELNCSHGAIYYHFHNKADLFYAIVEADFNQLNGLIDKAVNGPGDDETNLRQLFLRFLEFGLNNQNQYEIMFIVRHTEVDGLAQEAALKCYQKFAQSVHQLSNKKLAIKDVWSAFLSAHGFISHYRGYVNQFDEAQEAANLHVDFILKTLVK